MNLLKLILSPEYDMNKCYIYGNPITKSNILVIGFFYKKEWTFMYKKMRFYMPLLIILWGGALVEGLASEMKEYKQITAIEAIQNNSKDTQILHKREENGKMELLEMELEAGDLLTAYQGEMVKSLYGDNFYSFYGYSDKIENYIISDNEKINLNLVITYDEENNTTQIIWATPFLNEDF